MPSASQMLKFDTPRLFSICNDVARCFHDQDFDLEVFEAPVRRNAGGTVEIVEIALEQQKRAGLKRVFAEYLDFQVMFIDEYGYYGNVSNLRERGLSSTTRNRYRMNQFYVRNGVEDPINLTIRRSLGVSHRLYRGLITHYTFGLRRSELPRQSILQEQNESREPHATVLRGSLSRENHFDDERGMARMITYPGVNEDDATNDHDVQMEVVLYRQFLINYLDRMRAQPENERSTDHHAMNAWDRAIHEINAVRNRTEHAPMVQEPVRLVDITELIVPMLQAFPNVAAEQMEEVD